MNTEISPSSCTHHNVDTEAQSQSNNLGWNHRASSIGTAGLRPSILHNSSPEHREERSRATSRSSKIADDANGNQDATDTSHITPQPNSEWKQWKAEDPLLTKIPTSQTTMEDWVKAMDASDDGMCKGWRDQIDTLIIFAGLFSATVTAFTVESYRWLEETPADTLARLQLRNMLNATQDPAIDHLAPATFNVSSASVIINTLWFASLTLSLAAVVISILCKQWLHEYQRYDNFTTNEAFLIHGLRYRGLQAWRVPEIIAFLPILLQTALVLFLIGILVLLWPLQTIVVSITTIIVGLTFLFLGITTVLPSIQYIFPRFDTQCAYKSSQSWSFFFISAFWLFNFAEFTSWASFDRWEVVCVYNGTGSTLSRVYKLLRNSVDAVLSIYSFLADKSLKPTINADLALLSDFIDQLDASQKQIMRRVSSPADLEFEHSKQLRRIEQLRGCLGFFHHPLNYHYHRSLKPGISVYPRPYIHGASPVQDNVDHVHHSRTQSTLGRFLRIEHDISHPALFNRCIEHLAHGIDVEQAVGKWEQTPFDLYFTDAHDYDPAIAKYLVELYAHQFKTGQFLTSDMMFSLSNAYPSLMESHHQHKFNPSPVTLLKDIQEWVDRVPESDLHKKAIYAEDTLCSLAVKSNLLETLSEYHTSDLEKQYFSSFVHFFVALYEREDFLQVVQTSYSRPHVERALTFFRAYLDQN